MSDEREEIARTLYEATPMRENTPAKDDNWRVLPWAEVKADFPDRAARAYREADAILARAQGPGEAVAWRPFKDAPYDAGPLLFRVTYPDGFCFYSAVEWRDGHFASSYQTNFVPGSPSVEHERTVEWVKISATPPREG